MADAPHFLKSCLIKPTFFLWVRLVFNSILAKSEENRKNFRTRASRLKFSKIGKNRIFSQFFHIFGKFMTFIALFQQGKYILACQKDF